MEPRLRPIDFATALCNQLPFFENNQQKKQQTIEALSNSILDQITQHIDKNTFFPRVRFCRKEEDIISNEQICVNCDSVLNNPDYCIHCGQLYEKKAGVTAQNAQNAIPSSLPQPSAQQHGQMNQLASSANLDQIKRQQQLIPPTSGLNKAQSEIIKEPISNILEITHQQNCHKDIKRLVKEYTFSGKERKICKKCGEINPFFKNECSNCRFKFPKTRGLHSAGLQSENYTLYFWDMLHSDPLFSSLDQINDFLEEKDFMCVRDLYKKIKEILSQPNTERIFDITDTQLLDLHQQIDEAFEVLLTNNPYTDHVFNDATSVRTGRKRTRQVVFNFKEAQYILDRKLQGREQTDHHNEQSLTLEDTVLGKRQQQPSYLENQFKARIKKRPHNYESTQLQKIVHNINLLNQMGFLEPEVQANEQVNRVMQENNFAMSNIKKRGRPKKFDLTYEDMLSVDNWDDSKLVFTSNMLGGGGQQEDENERNDQIPTLQPNGQLTVIPKKVVLADGNLDVCGICQRAGKLICCDDCPAAFHADCLGYERQFPRGKWKCYFCKVAKHGIRQITRMAPSESPMCDALAEDLETWEDKAVHMLDILKNYQCMSTFFDKITLTPVQEESIKKMRNLEVLDLPETIQDIYDKVAKNTDLKSYTTSDQFYEALKTTFTYYFESMENKRDLLLLQARSCLILLEKLIEENEIFSHVRPAQKPKKVATSKNVNSKTQAVTRGQMGKSFGKQVNVMDEDSEEENSIEESSVNNKDQMLEQDLREDSDFEVNIGDESKTIEIQEKHRQTFQVAATGGRTTRSTARKLSSQ